MEIQKHVSRRYSVIYFIVIIKNGGLNLRYFNPAGSFDSFNFIGNNFSLDNLFPFINLVASGRENYLNIFGNDWDTPDGTCIRDYIHIMDLSQAHLATIEMLFEKIHSILI